MHLHLHQSSYTYKSCNAKFFLLCTYILDFVRCVTDAGNEKFECEDYDIPYNGWIPPDPTFEDMRKIVCEEGYRPEIPQRWNKSKVIKQMHAYSCDDWID